jgi:3-oxoacyl-[acyl-carrier-protein] synthase-3
MNCRFTIRDIAVKLGETRLEVRHLGASYEAVVVKTGIEFVYESSQTALELASEAANQVIARNSDRVRYLKYLIFVSQSPSSILPGPASFMQHRCKLPEEVFALDVNLGCSGFVQALSMTARLLQGSDTTDALIVCADTYRRKLRADDRSTNAIFSDGATATWICGGGESLLLAEKHATYGTGALLLHQPIHDDGAVGSLHMSGPDVLVFTQRKVPQQILSVLKAASLEVDDVSMMYLHQASKLVLDSIAAKLGPSVVIPTNLQQVGNLVSSSIPALLVDNWFSAQKGAYVLSGFGVGLSASTVVLVKA